MYISLSEQMKHHYYNGIQNIKEQGILLVFL